MAPLYIHDREETSFACNALIADIERLRRSVGAVTALVATHCARKPSVGVARTLMPGIFVKLARTWKC